MKRLARGAGLYAGCGASRLPPSEKNIHHFPAPRLRAVSLSLGLLAHGQAAPKRWQSPEAAYIRVYMVNNIFSSAGLLLIKQDRVDYTAHMHHDDLGSFCNNTLKHIDMGQNAKKSTHSFIRYRTRTQL